VCRAVAEEIPEEADRKRFLERTVPDEPPLFGPGCLLARENDGTGLAVDGTYVRALTEVRVLALPEPPSRRKAGAIAAVPSSAAG
jgi:hypothetical protein